MWTEAQVTGCWLEGSVLGSSRVLVEDRGDSVSVWFLTRPKAFDGRSQLHEERMVKRKERRKGYIVILTRNPQVALKRTPPEAGACWPPSI